MLHGDILVPHGLGVILRLRQHTVGIIGKIHIGAASADLRIPA